MPKSKSTTAQLTDDRRASSRDRREGSIASRDVDEKGIPRPPQEYIGFGGNISSDLKEEFGLSRSQSEALQNVTSEFWGDLASWAAKNVSCDETASEAAPDGATIYRLQAMQPTEREKLLTELASRYDEVAGRAVSDALVAGLNENNAFAFMGKYDAVIRITAARYSIVDPSSANKSTELPAKVNGEMVGSYVLSIPNSGKVVYSNENLPFSKLTGTFGNIFQK